MLKSGERIIIQKVANGYMVSPYIARDEVVNIENVHVFNQMQPATHHAESLLSFIMHHFEPQND